jgi:hypothetical protein
MAWVTEPEFARNSAMTSSLGFVIAAVSGCYRERRNAAVVRHGVNAGRTTRHQLAIVIAMQRLNRPRAGPGCDRAP